MGITIVEMGMPIFLFMKKRLHLFLFFALFICIGNLRAQSLIPNGDFEEYTFCPGDMQTIQEGACTSWFQPVKDCTPDYFNLCATVRSSTIPENTMGYQSPSSGKGYIGLWASVPGMNYKEYIACMLKSPLEKGKQYKIHFNISLANNSSYSLRGLGIAFTNFYPVAQSKYEYMLLPHLQYDSGVQLSDTAKWMPIDFTYTANGNELYFILGNFDFGDKGLQKLPYKPEHVPLWKGAYYYVDEMTCEEIKPPPPKDSVIVQLPTKDQKAEMKEKYASAFSSGYVLTRVFFDIDKYDLKPESDLQLDSVVMFLNLFPELKIEISGHTDSTATEAHNQVLSQNRAEEVRKYFIRRGISDSRLVARGYASTRPLDTNATVAGRSRNRRVEFRVVE